MMKNVHCLTSLNRRKQTYVQITELLDKKYIHPTHNILKKNRDNMILINLHIKTYF